MMELCDVIESTCAVVISLEAANCCGASDFRSGMPRPPYYCGCYYYRLYDYLCVSTLSRYKSFYHSFIVFSPLMPPLDAYFSNVCSQKGLQQLKVMQDNAVMLGLKIQ